MSPYLPKVPQNSLLNSLAGNDYRPGRRHGQVPLESLVVDRLPLCDIYDTKPRASRQVTLNPKKYLPSFYLPFAREKNAQQFRKEP